MAQYFLEAEERRRASLALSMREQSGVKIGEICRQFWTLLFEPFRNSGTPHVSSDPGPYHDINHREAGH